MAPRLTGLMDSFSRPSNERRRAVRISEELPFVIGHAGFEVEAITINLSLSGVMCRVDREISMMTQLAVALTLPSEAARSRGKTIRMKGVVVRKEKDLIPDKWLLAVYFADIKTEDRDALETYIQRRLGSV